MSTVIGIDVGGTKVAAMALRGQTLGKHVQQPTALSGTDELVEQFVELVGQAAEGERYEAVGIGVPSVVRFATGEITSSVNIPLAGVALRSVLGERLGVPVFVDNDATVAALAEAHDEQLALVSQNLVMYTVGTGIGGGIVIGGRIFRGSTGGAGELGHTIVGVRSQPDVALAGEHFPQLGSLESLCSGTALDRFAEAVAAERPDSALGRLAAGGAEIRGADAVAAAAAGDAPAEAAVKRWAHALGVGIANAVNTFDPDEVVIGGGGAAAGAALVEPAIACARGYAHPGLRDRINVRLARWGANAGVVGACLLAVHELERDAA